MTIDARVFRTTLGHFATGVTVVTTCLDNRRYGFTANAFTSVSLDPPLVLIAIGTQNGSRAAIEASGNFCVNILRAEQVAVARCFATNGPEKYDHFCSATSHTATTGAPVIDGSLAWVDCRLTATYPGGDHVLLLGEVLDLGAVDGEPLLFYRGAYLGS